MMKYKKKVFHFYVKNNEWTSEKHELITRIHITLPPDMMSKKMYNIFETHIENFFLSFF